jgi:O-methyltransferase
MINKILYFLDKYIDLNIIRKFLHFFRYVYFKIKSLIEVPFIDKKKREKNKIIFQSLPYSMAGHKALENCFDMTVYVNKKNLIGDICEFGVARGGCALAIALTDRQINKELSRKIFLFDSFEGLPAPDEKKDFDERGIIGKAIFPLRKGSLNYKVKEVKYLFYKKFNFNKDKIIFVKGFFEKTAKDTKDKVGDISILRLDGDWYNSVFIPLVFYYEKVTKGGVIIIDDYRTCIGASNAIKDFEMKINTKFKLKNYSKGGVYFFKT